MIDNGFWNHSKQHSSKTLKNTSSLKYCFGTIRNNTALKLVNAANALKEGFGTIRNNTALKHHTRTLKQDEGFGTIRNNTALKPRRKIFLTKFRNRTIHPSQTSARQIPIVTFIISCFQSSRNSLDPAHTAGNHRLF